MDIAAESIEITKDKDVEGEKSHELHWTIELGEEKCLLEGCSGEADSKVV